NLHRSSVSNYLRSSKFNLAREPFDQIPERDLFSWNVMLTGYVRNQRLGDVLRLFDLILDKDVVSWNSLETIATLLN
ncbi:hypothetical protein RYX36_002777, partial [Vicia faba]